MKLHKEHTPLPGTERYTQPSEIKALSKFLGHIKEIQEEHTKIEEDNLALPGDKDNKDTSLPRFPGDITSLPGHVLPVEGINPEEPQLSKFRDTLKSGSDQQLETHREIIEDHQIPGLEDEKITLKSPDEPSLEDMVLEISTDETLALEDEKIEIKDSREVGLSAERLEIEGKEITPELSTYSETLKEGEKKEIGSLEENSKVTSLPGHQEIVSSLETDRTRQNLEKPKDIPLEDKVEKIRGPKDLPLGDEKVSIKGPKDIPLEDKVEKINGPKDISLEDGSEKIKAPKDIPLEVDFERLQKPEDIQLSDGSEKISSSKEVSLENDLEKIEKPKDVSLEVGKEEIHNQKEISSLPGSKETISTDGGEVLSERAINLPGSPKDISLEDKSLSIDKGEDIPLRDGREGLDVPSGPDKLEDKLKTLHNTGGINSLETEVIKIGKKEVNSLGGEVLGIKPKDTPNLSEGMEVIQAPTQTSLSSAIEKIYPEDEVSSLEEGKEILNSDRGDIDALSTESLKITVSETPNLSEGKEILTPQDSPESLSSKVISISPTKDISLETGREEITIGEGDIELPSESIGLGGGGDIESLEDHLESIFDDFDISLSETKLNLVSEGTDLSLETENLVRPGEDIEIPGLSEFIDTILPGGDLESLEDTIINLSKGSDQELDDTRIEIGVPGDIELDTTRRNIQDHRENSLGEYKENIQDTRENNLSEYKEEIEDSHENSLEDLILGLDDSREPLGLSKYLENRPPEGDRIEIPRGKEDRGFNSWRDRGTGNLEPLETPEDFEDYLKSKPDYSLPEVEGYYERTEDYLEKKERVIVLRPGSAEDSDRTTTSTSKGFNAWFSKLTAEEQEEWKESHTPPVLDEYNRVLRPVNAENGDRTLTTGEEGPEFWKNRNVTGEVLETPEDFEDYLKSKPDYSLPEVHHHEITELPGGKGIFSGGGWGEHAPGDIPKYKLPEIGWKSFWSGGALNPSTYLRWAVDNTVGALPLRGSAKQKVIDETLHFLVWGREALEKLSKSNRDRLPGDDMGLISDVVNGTNVKEAATKVLGAVGSAASKSVDHKNPINRPKDKQSDWVSPGQEVLDYDKKNTDDVGGGNFWKKLGSNLIGNDNTNVPGSQKRKFTDYINSGFILGNGGDKDTTNGFGIGVTLNDLIPASKGVSDLESFREALRSSRFITTPDKFTSTSNSTNYMTLDSNHVWEIFFRPYVGQMNGEKTWLPSFLEIDFQNKNAFNYTTHYSRGWLPITGFELQEKKLTSKDLPLFDGAVSYPVSMEFTNELRITFADDSLKSLKRYFDLCAKVSAYMSNIHAPYLIETEITTEENLEGLTYTRRFIQDMSIYDKPIDEVKDITNPTVYLDGKIHPGLYKNLSFLVSLYVLTPQYGTVKKCNLLCVLKDYTIENQGEIDSSPTELNVTFSIVGENPVDTPPLGKIASYDPPQRPDSMKMERTGTGLLDNLGGIMSVF